MILRNYFLQEVLKAVREKTKGVPVFKETENGTIRISIVPFNKKASEWLDDCTDYMFFPRSGPNDTQISEFVYKIDRGGSHVINTKDGPVDTYAFSAMKVAYCREKMKRYDHKSMKSDRTAKMASRYGYVEENGYGGYKGCVCHLVEYYDHGVWLTWAEIYVCVSGASAEEDEACAMASRAVVKKLVRSLKDDGFIARIAPF